MIQFLRDHDNFILHTEQWLPIPRPELFDFFADAFQLERITPPWLHFHVLTPRPIRMSAGLKIDYRLRLRWIPVRWQSEISVWEPPHRFVDRQLRGPYRLWHHEHTFLEREGGTLVIDHIAYRVPGGTPVNRCLVEPDLRRIFEFRRDTLATIFPPKRTI
jgi:ligand-binding SRPBCC domain-containing protein